MSGEGLEQAAIAFDAEVSGSSPSGKSEEKQERPAERMFGNVGTLDDDSPIAGGDALPVKTRAKQIVEDDGEGDTLPEFDDEGNVILREKEGEEEGDEEDQPEAKKKGEGDEDEEDDIFVVKVDGEEVEVGLREALDGYVRQETFYRRLSALNDVKQELVKQASDVAADRQKYVGLIEEMEKHLQLLSPKEPDWDAEYAKDPVAARQLEKRFKEYKDTLANLSAEKGKVSKEQSEADARAQRDYIETENRKIMATNPSWNNKEIFKRDTEAMALTAQAAGFSEEEIKQVYDHRMVAILLKAAKYDRLQANKPKPVRRGKKSVSSGAGSSRTAPRGDQAMKQLSKTGSVDAAAAVFTGMINRR